jgi:hypothetical protein
LKDEEIDRILASEEDILPSSGFHASVMEAIHREASTPPPIPFPWRRAWPGFAAAALLGAFALPLWESEQPAAVSAGASSLALAAFATVGSLLLSRRLAGERY